MLEVTLPGIITGDELAEKREGFTIAGIRYETPGLDSGGFDLDDEDGRTVFLFEDVITAGMFKLRWQ
jgi:orotate phosphoribosyltransferase